MKLEDVGDISKCVRGFVHSWGLWRQTSDIINIDDGSTGGYVYCRECTVCPVQQKVKKLQLVDEPVLYEGRHVSSIGTERFEAEESAHQERLKLREKTP